MVKDISYYQELPNLTQFLVCNKPKQSFGSFPIITEIVANPELLDVYKKSLLLIEI